MIYLVFGLIALGVIAMIAGFVRNQRLQKQLERGEITELPTMQQVENME
mgnify:CR=1 FL=1